MSGLMESELTRSHARDGVGFEEKAMRLIFKKEEREIAGERGWLQPCGGEAGSGSGVAS